LWPDFLGCRWATMDYISEPDNCDSPTPFDNQKQQEEVDPIYPAYRATSA